MRRNKKISVDDVNLIPELLAKGKMSIHEAQDLVWEHIYFNPVLYGISDFEHDQKSDFLLFISKRIKRYISEYVKEKNSTLISYLIMLLKYEKKTWIRINAKKITEQTSCMENFEINYESQFEDYKKLEPEHCVAELNEIDIDRIKKFTLNTKEKEVTKETVLLLLLKACHNIDDKMIKAVSQYCKIDEEKLFSLIEDLRLKSLDKFNGKQELLCRIQNHYYFHKKYEMELSKINRDTRDYQKIKAKAERRSASWRRYVFALQNIRTPSPSNSAIAEALNINERTVQRYIERAKKKRLEILKPKEDDCSEKI